MNKYFCIATLSVAGLVYTLAASHAVDADSEPTLEEFSIEAETATNVDHDKVRSRTNARRQETLWLQRGEETSFPAAIETEGDYLIRIFYSNDDEGRCDDVLVKVDGRRKAKFHTENTRKPGMKGGEGWNEFAVSKDIPVGHLSNGIHTVTVLIDDGDAFGVEIDRLDFILKASDVP